MPGTIKISRLRPTHDQVTVDAALPLQAVPCPGCGHSSRRLHSRYVRVLRDLPWQGRLATIRIAARRFRCLNMACARRTFAEHLGAVAGRSARRTTRLGDLQRHVELALGGAAAARLAQRLVIPTSADTMLRLLAKPDHARSAPSTPRVLGVDDWAWRRGRRYGTILVDLEHNEVVDHLPDRQAETLARWLRRHTGIEVVARDRAGAYADGIRQGAPDAIQVADRWHLLRNLGDAVRAVIDRHHAIQRAAGQLDDARTAPDGNAVVSASVAPRMTAARRRSQDAHGRRRSRYEEAARLRAAGTPISAIAASLGAERKTIRRWLRAGRAPLWSMPSRANILAPYLAHLDRRWTEGCRNASLLWREVVGLGFTGRAGVVLQWAKARRDKAPPSRRSRATPVPSGCSLARLIMTDPDMLPNAERILVLHLLEQLPVLADTVAVAKRLTALLRREASERLDLVLDAAARTPLRDFAARLRRDVDAIQAALDLPWTTSPVEGQVNRLKMIKRTMYGRAGFQLLRARVLHAA